MSTPSKTERILAFWREGGIRQTEIARRVGVSEPLVSRVIAAAKTAERDGEPAPKPRKSEAILALWDAGERCKNTIRDTLGVSHSYLDQVLRERGMLGDAPPRMGRPPSPRPDPPKARTCQRPDVDNGLRPCGRPLHKLPCGESLGVCTEHWESGKPIANGHKKSRLY